MVRRQHTVTEVTDLLELPDQRRTECSRQGAVVVDSIELRCKVVVLAIALAVAACSSAPRASQAATDGTFVVTVSVPSGTHHASDAPDVVATLTYQGPAPSIAVDGDDVGLVHFTFKQLDGRIPAGRRCLEDQDRGSLPWRAIRFSLPTVPGGSEGTHSLCLLNAPRPASA